MPDVTHPVRFPNLRINETSFSKRRRELPSTNMPSEMLAMMILVTLYVQGSIQDDSGRASRCLQERVLSVFGTDVTRKRIGTSVSAIENKFGYLRCHRNEKMLYSIALNSEGLEEDTLAEIFRIAEIVEKASNAVPESKALEVSPKPKESPEVAPAVPQTEITARSIADELLIRVTEILNGSSTTSADAERIEQLEKALKEELAFKREKLDEIRRLKTENAKLTEEVGQLKRDNSRLNRTISGLNSQVQSSELESALKAHTSFGRLQSQAPSNNS